LEQEENRDELDRKIENKIDLKAEEYLSNPTLY
jgi:hypothetical protein